MKLNLHTDLHIDGPTIFERRLESPMLDSIDSFSIETKSQAALHANIPGMPARVDNQPENACSLLFCTARFFGVIGIGSRNRGRRRDPTAYTVYSTTHAAANSRADARSMTSADPTARAGSDTATGTRSIGWRGCRHRHGRRCAEGWHVILGKMHSW